MIPLFLLHHNRIQKITDNNFEIDIEILINSTLGFAAEKGL